MSLVCVTEGQTLHSVATFLNTELEFKASISSKVDLLHTGTTDDFPLYIVAIEIRRYLGV